jgi:HK97 family phage major capsid protein
MFVRSNRDPCEDLDRVRSNLVSGPELRARALDLIENDNKRSSWQLSDDRAQAATLRSQDDHGIAQHVLMTGTKEYREAYANYLRHPGLGMRYDTPSLEATRAFTLTNANGGFLLPYILDPTIILTNNASANPFRRVSRVETTTSNAWQGVNSAGVNAALVAEGATAADAAPSDLAQVQVKPQKFAAWVLGTYEALDDENIGVQLPGMFADAKDRIESSYFATGSGTLAPLGIVTAMGVACRVAPGATGTAFQRSTATTGGLNDVLNLQATLPPRFRKSGKCAFMGNIFILNAVRGLDVYGGGAFWTNLTTDTPPSLMGQPVYEASDFPSTLTGTSAATGTASFTLVYGDWSNFIIADRVGFSMLYDPLIKGTGSSAQLPAGEAGWYGFWRVGSTTGTTAAFRNLTVS